MTRLARAAPARAPRCPASAGSSCSSPSQPAERGQRLGDLSWVRPTACCSTSAADACPNAQAWTCCETGSTRRSLVELRPRSRSGCRRSASAARRGRPRRFELRRGSRSDAASRRMSRGVERRVHARRHVVPPGPSSKHDALGLELVADAVGGGEVAALLGLGALGDARLDVAPPSPSPWNQLVPSLSTASPSSCRTGLERRRIVIDAPSAALKRERRVEIVDKRLDHVRRRPAPASASPA